MSVSGCGSYRGVNSLPLPGTAGGGANSFKVYIQMPDVTAIEQNSRVRVADVTVGNVSGIERQGWHALVTVTLRNDIDLPENAVAKIGQTSLLGSQHIELAPPPPGTAPAGRLANGDTIPLDRAGQYPTTEETLAAVSTVFNGSGLGQLQQISTELNAALGGRETEVRGLIGRLNTFVTRLDAQKTDIIAAMDGLNRLSRTANRQTDVLNTALDKIPPALQVLNEQRRNLLAAIQEIGDLAATGNDIVTTSRDDIVSNLRNLQPALKGIADSGRDFTRSFGIYTTMPWPESTLSKWVRGDYANLSATIDLTLGRIDNSMLQGTPVEGRLTALETALGRTQGRQPGLGTPNPLQDPVEDGQR
ncbi:MCE family protein [Gordonia rubripertincta]|uniref:MCE family protein n=1 Tax=Gordonia rubripertincta TaxID=36822 RepID=UPI0020C4E271|nr:MCE family protein [Gordonia rubripertincta]